MFVKICGITNQVDAELAIAAGADALGFNFWPGSRRYLEPAKAADWIRELPDTVVRVGVVVNPTESYATTITALDGIDVLQLHGAESPEFCLNLVEADILLWKALGYLITTPSGSYWIQLRVGSLGEPVCHFLGGGRAP